ncbi:hypothetical protein PR202_gb06043 [Eleusine coracana subsp. coracana]|uniref:Tetrahydrofolate dehydrogenase/cyclohydrolase NAD(P)-binding domain-containing protein n=1 Tax=Eleusine coracana subsp. coracana TaxID=191504 RepID=A0AAV5E8J7_ELECO|nr:hypothetical protein PR202_gb06043 [Eleusine coracana subsp. coracana]
MASSILSDCSSARLLPFRRALLPPPAARFRPCLALVYPRRLFVSSPAPLPPRLRRMDSVLAAAASSADSATVSTDALAKIIDGKMVAKQIREEIAVEITRMKDAIGIVPGLAVILVHMNDENILNAVSIEKDVDGFHPLNIGRLAMQGRDPFFVPCTPKGCMELLHRYGVEIKGKRAVVIGRSNIVGMPAALLLQKANATVSIVHSQTKNPEEITRQADIVIAAVGVANLIRGNWIKPGAAIIDVGINPVDDLDSPRGYRLVGDVCYEEASKVAGAITPVPGGVGPMTIAMLLSNTLESAKRINKFK